MKTRRLSEKDIPFILEWMRDPALTCFYRFDASNATEESIGKFVEKANASASDFHLAVVDEQDEYLGTASLKNIDRVNLNAELALAFRRKAMGSGVPLLTAREMERIAFKELRLRRLYMNVLSSNGRCICFLNKLHYSYEGEFKKHVMIDGELADIKWFAILSEQSHV